MATFRVSVGEPTPLGDGSTSAHRTPCEKTTRLYTVLCTEAMAFAGCSCHAIHSFFRSRRFVFGRSLQKQ